MLLAESMSRILRNNYNSETAKKIWPVVVRLTKDASLPVRKEVIKIYTENILDHLDLAKVPGSFLEELSNRSTDGDPGIRTDVLTWIGKFYNGEVSIKLASYLDKKMEPNSNLKLPSGETVPYFSALVHPEMLKTENTSSEEWDKLQLGINKLGWIPGFLLEHVKRFNSESDTSTTFKVIDTMMIPSSKTESSVRIRAFALMFFLGKLDLSGDSLQAAGLRSFIILKARARDIVHNFLKGREKSRSGNESAAMENHYKMLAGLVLGIDPQTALKSQNAQQFKCAMLSAKTLHQHRDGNVFKLLKLMCDPLQDRGEIDDAENELKKTFKKDSKERDFLVNVVRRLSPRVLNHEIFHEVIKGVSHLADVCDGSPVSHTAHNICAAGLQFVDLCSKFFPMSFVPSVSDLISLLNSKHNRTLSVALSILERVVPKLNQNELEEVNSVEEVLMSVCLESADFHNSTRVAKVLCHVWHHSMSKNGSTFLSKNISTFLNNITSRNVLSFKNKKLPSSLGSLAKFAKLTDIFDTTAEKIFDFLKHDMLGSQTEAEKLKITISESKYNLRDIFTTLRVRICVVILI